MLDNFFVVKSFILVIIFIVFKIFICFFCIFFIIKYNGLNSILVGFIFNIKFFFNIFW